MEADGSWEKHEGADGNISALVGVQRGSQKSVEAIMRLRALIETVWKVS